MTETTGSGGRWRAGRRLATGLAAIGAAGLLHVGLGDWRDGPGAGGWIVPLVCYVMLLIAAACLCYPGERDAADAGGRGRQPLLPVLVASACAVAYFQAVLALGLATATFVAVIAAILLLSADRRAARLRAVAIGTLAALGFYIVFGRLAPIVLDGALFI